MINNTLNTGINLTIKSAIDLYPDIQNYNVTIQWDDEIHLRDIEGTINECKNGDIVIKISPYYDYLDIIDTIRHELAHLIQYSKGEKLKHGKKFDKLCTQLQAKWFELMREESR